MSLFRSMLVPHFENRDWWNTWNYPTEIMDQCFGNQMLEEELLAPRFVRGFLIRPRTQTSLDDSGKSEVKNTPENFQVALNVSQFRPEELSVKVVDKFIVVHGKHEEKTDDHGFVAREFTRRYMLPQDCEAETVASSLSPNGILTIKAAKKMIEEGEKQERDIPIAQA